MDKLFHKLKVSLGNNRLSTLALMSYIVQLVGKELGYEALDGYVKFDVVYIRFREIDKLALLTKKHLIIEKINKSLHDQGYEYKISDIRLLYQRNSKHSYSV